MAIGCFEDERQSSRRRAKKILGQFGNKWAVDSDAVEEAEITDFVSEVVDRQTTRTLRVQEITESVDLPKPKYDKMQSGRKTTANRYDPPDGFVSKEDEFADSDPDCYDCTVCDGEGVLDCTRCETSGKHECPECDDGREKCQDEPCNGRGKYTCPTCDGDTYRSCPNCQETGAKTCEECGGSERIECPNSLCTGGFVDCKTCSQEASPEGTIACVTCGGDGSITKEKQKTSHADGTDTEDIIQEEIDCSDCDGTGSIRCQDCNGLGEERCQECDGRGDLPCDNCQNGVVTCTRCEGDERIACEECDSDGLFTCSTCGGDGFVPCGMCDGETVVACNRCDGDGRLECTNCAQSGTFCSGLRGQVEYISESSTDFTTNIVSEDLVSSASADEVEIETFVDRDVEDVGGNGLIRKDVRHEAIESWRIDYIAKGNKYTLFKTGDNLQPSEGYPMSTFRYILPYVAPILFVLVVVGGFVLSQSP